MKKKVLLALLTTAMVSSISVNAAEPEFDPNPDYDKWTVVEYTIADINADLVCTVSASEDESEFNIQCNFYGDDQDWTGTFDGEATTKIADKTGFMDGDAVNIVKAAIEQADWTNMGEEPAGEAADDTAEAADGEAAGGAVAVWDVEPEFDPADGYDIYTVVEYTIEDINADLICTVSAKEDGSEFNIQCNFYGDDQDWTGTFDGEATTKIADKTGFMDGDAANILAAATADDNQWAWIADDVVVGSEGEAAATAEEAADDTAEAADVAFPTEAEFDPADGYAEYTVVEYTIEDINADLICTVSANEDKTEFNIQCNFYGDDQDWTGTFDGDATTKIADKTGFMDGDAANIIKAALEQDIWAPIA